MGLTRRMASEIYSSSVFMNYPFDDQYKNTERALIFVISYCGFLPRSARELIDSGETRIDKILRIIGECQYGIHDISRTELDDKTNLPRFNMPFELGLFIGAKKFGTGKQKDKTCLIIDDDKYRYQKFISDISGQDVEAYSGETDILLGIVRDWLSQKTARKRIPGKSYIIAKYTSFLLDLPGLCQDMNTREDELTFVDYSLLISTWQSKFYAES